MATPVVEVRVVFTVMDGLAMHDLSCRGLHFKCDSGIHDFCIDSGGTYIRMPQHLGNGLQ